MRKQCLLFVILLLSSQLFAQNNKLKWVYETGTYLHSVPAISSDSTVYFNDGVIYALTPNGKLKWQYDPISSARFPTIGADGTIYFGDSDGLCALNPDGSLKWRNNDAEEVVGAPAIGQQGTIYTVHKKGLLAVNLDGSTKWEYLKMGPAIACPVIGPDGTVYVASEDDRIYAVDLEGNLRWSFQASIYPSRGFAAVGADGTLYFGTQSPQFYALNPDGTLKWTYNLHNIFTFDRVWSQPVIAPDGTLYFGSDYGILYAINPNGSKKWSYETGDAITSSPAIGKNGVIYFGGTDNNLYGLRPDGTLQSSYQTGGPIQCSPTIADDGTVYFGSADGNLYALETDCGGLAISDWPAYQKNSAHTGNATNPDCPVAQAKQRYVLVPAGQTVTLDASNSYDPNGDPLSFKWQLLDLPEDVSVINVTMSTPENAATEINISTCHYGKYTFSITVTDQKDGASTVIVVIDYGPLKWFFETGQHEVTSPAIAADGTLYISSRYNGVYALNPDGSQKWNYQEDNCDFNSPAIGDDGTIYVSSNRQLCALNQDGTLKWAYQPVNTHHSPTICADGTVYFYTYNYPDRKLCALNQDGSLKWTYLLDDDITAQIVGPDGTIYFGSYNNNLYALNPNGSLKWIYYTEKGMCFPPAVTTEGMIYFVSYNNSFCTLYALNPDGSQQWNYAIIGYPESAPVIDMEGTIHIRVNSIYTKSHAFAINPDGTLKWEYGETRVTDSATSAIGADGSVFIESSYNRLAVLDPTGSLKWTYQAEKRPWQTWGHVLPMTISTDGTVYFGTNNLETGKGRLYAIKTNCGGLASSDWPCYQKNSAHTGNAVNINCPIAKISQKYFQLRKGETITLDATNSYDPNGDPLDFTWRLISHPEGVRDTDVIITDPDATETEISIISDSYGKYTFSVTVTDNKDGVSAEVIIVDYGPLKWRFQTAGEIWSSPAIGADSTIVFGSNDNKVYALNPDGSLKWEYVTQGNVYSSPAIGDDGSIYIGSEDCTLYVLNPDGTFKTKYYSERPIVSSPAIGPDGRVYIGNNRGDIYSLKPNDRNWLVAEWFFRTNGYVSSSAAIGSDGAVFFGSEDKKVYALNPDGSLRWEYLTGGKVNSSPAIGKDGTIYIGSDDKKVYAIEQNGSLKWAYLTDDAVNSSPAIDADGTIYIGSDDHKLYALNSDGSLKWACQTTGPVKSSPAIAFDGTIYFGGNDGLYARKPDGRLEIEYQTEEPLHSSPVIETNGTIYIGSLDGSMYACETGCGGLSTDAVWPMWGYNPSHTRRTINSTEASHKPQTTPKEFRVYANYPNPFNPITQIAFDLPKSDIVSVSIFNILGRKVRNIYSGYLSAGHHTLKWDATNSQGHPVRSGIYFLHVQTSDTFQIQKMTMMH